MGGQIPRQKHNEERFNNNKNNLHTEGYKNNRVEVICKAGKFTSETFTES